MKFLLKGTTFIILLLLVFGCNTKVNEENEALKAELAALAEENLALGAGNFDLIMDIAGYQATLLEIDGNLAKIDAKKGKVNELKGSPDSVEEDILLHLDHIHKSMTNSKHKIAGLNESLDDLYLNDEIEEEEIYELEMALDEATEEILVRDAAIDGLNNEVIAEGIDIAILSDAYDDQVAMSTVLYAALNTAYFIIGTEKELKEFGVYDKEDQKGVIRKIKKVNADASNSLFTAIPIDETDGVIFQAKKAFVATPHPEGSYEFKVEKKEDIGGLAILDKAAFWDKTDYLIIVVEKQ